MPMTSDEHAEMLMLQNNRRLVRSSLIGSLIAGIVLLGIGYLIFTLVIQNDSNPDSQLFLMMAVVLLAAIALSRLFFRLPRKRPLDIDQDDIRHFSK